MTRAKRIRITLALMAVILGLAVSYFGPVVSPVIVSQTVSNADDYGGRFQTQVSMAVVLSGMAIAVLAFVYVFFAWASWFIGPRLPSGISVGQAIPDSLDLESR